MTPDADRLAAYLEGTVPGFAGPIAFHKFDTGQSNPTFLMETPSGRYVLRRKPPGELLKSAHAVDREFRVQAALAGSGVPVPEMLHLCEDEGVIGSVFYVMAYLEGRNFNDPSLPGHAPEERGAIFDDMNWVLAALHSVDPEAVGLGDFGKPGNYFARQFDRWTKQYRASQTGPSADMDRLIGWLTENLPEDDGRVSLVHGDYRLDNLMYAPDAARVIAVLDWELSTLGHPFADLAYQCMAWRMEPGDVGRGLAGLDRTALGIPTEEEYVARYCARMGIDGIPGFRAMLAWSFFRFAAILEGVKRRALDGNASNPEKGLAMGALVPAYARLGVEVIEGG